jgi:hypothetical protein
VNTARSFHRRSVFKTLALWLGLAAMMVQATAPLCAAGLMGATGGGVASIVICTAHGFETVTVGADGQPLPAGPVHNAQDCCAACHAPGGFTAPAPVLVAVPFRIAHEDASFATAPAAAPRFYSSYVTRGPPVLSFARQA